MNAATAMFAYADAMCAERRAHPRDDLMTVLLEADVDGDRLNDMQLSSFFMLLQNAGSETTRNLITTGTLALLRAARPARACVRDDPSLLPSAIEELLRHTTPVMSFTRTATNDTEIGGQAIQRGRPRAASSTRRPTATSARSTSPTTSTSPATPTTTSRSAPAARTSASARTSPGSRPRLMFEAILTRFEGLEVTADPDALPRVHSNLIDGFAEMPVRWSAVR